MDELDVHIFICNKCKNQFNHTDGTWLPIGEEKQNIITGKHETLTVLSLTDLLKKPEIITSDEFTCYDCAP